MPFWQLWADYCVALADNNHPGETCRKVFKAREDLQARGVKLGLSNIMVTEAELLLANHQTDEAVTRIAEVKKYIEETSEKYYEPEVYRIEGLIHQANGKPALAIQCFEHALAAASEQQAFWWQLRSATELAASTSQTTPLDNLLESYRGSEYDDISRAVATQQALLSTSPGS